MPYRFSGDIGQNKLRKDRGQCDTTITIDTASLTIIIILVICIRIFCQD
jgi:hypothetical protein